MTVADLCVDFTVELGDIPLGFSQDEHIVPSYSLLMGGSCGIFACQAAKLGLKVGVLGVVGSDTFGDLVLATLDESGVDTSLVRRTGDVRTGVSVHLSREKERTILTYEGSIVAVEPAEVTDDLLRSTRHLHIGSYFLLRQLGDLFPDMARRVRAFGGSVSLDTNWDPAGEWSGSLQDLLDQTDVFLPNEAELLAVTDSDGIDAGLGRMEERAGVTAVKLGEEGGIAARGGERAKVAGLPVTVEDTIGAGDSFDGGFLYGYLNGWSLESALKLACACGAASVRRAGGTSGQLKIDEVSRFLHGTGVRIPEMEESDA